MPTSGTRSRGCGGDRRCDRRLVLRDPPRKLVRCVLCAGRDFLEFPTGSHSTSSFPVNERFPSTCIRINHTEDFRNHVLHYQDCRGELIELAVMACNS
jgi:hypothetical protein